MPGHGPPPNPNSRKSQDRVQFTELGPELPLETPDSDLPGPPLPDGRDWPPETVAWWRNWRRHPQAGEWSSNDWDFLKDTARLHAIVWTMPDEVLTSRHGSMAELRLRVAKFGVTPEDRARLKQTMGSQARGEDPRRPLPKASNLDEERRLRLLRRTAE